MEPFLTSKQWVMLERISRLPLHWWTAGDSEDTRTLDALVTLRMARAKAHEGGLQYRITQYGLAELAARGE